MDSEPDGDGQAQGGAEASRAAYLRRLEQARRQQGQSSDPHQELSGRDRYLSELEGRWQEGLAPKQLHSRKHWEGA